MKADDFEAEKENVKLELAEEFENLMIKYELPDNNKNSIRPKSKKTETRGRKTLSKRQKVLNLLSKGQSVTWKALRNRFDLVSPRALVDTLRAEGNMIYVNKSAKGTSYRMGVPTKAIIAAGIKKLYGTPYAYKNA